MHVFKALHYLYENKMTDITHTGKVDMSGVTVGSMFAADIQGPYRIGSLTNNLYIFGLIDYKSRRLWQYFIDSKDKAFDCLKDFFTFEVNRLRKKYWDLGVISLIANGGEFVPYTMSRKDLRARIPLRITLS